MSSRASGDRPGDRFEKITCIWCDVVEAQGFLNRLLGFEGVSSREERPQIQFFVVAVGALQLLGRLRGITGDDVVGELGDCGSSSCFKALLEVAGAGRGLWGERQRQFQFRRG